MPIQPMGRNGLLQRHEVAQQLGVSKKQLRHLTRQGVILPARLGRTLDEALYHPEEVNAVLELRNRRVDLATVALMSMQAQALGRTINKKLNVICSYLGLEDNQLKRDEESMYQLHRRVTYTLEEDLSTLQAGAIVEWASIFNAIDEAYLQLLEHYTGNDSPWDIYLELANEIAGQRKDTTGHNMMFAYACLDASRRHLRHVAYFYVSTKFGCRTANKLFPKDALIEEIIAQLYPRTIGP